MKPLVSIITPSFNQGNFIRETIESVLSQSYDNIEYIVIDGGSTDNTLDILSQYEGKLTYISEPDKGQSDAINKGFRMAKGEIFAWLNSDDVYEPGAVQKAVELFTANPDVALVYGNGYIIDEKSNKVKAFEYTHDFSLWELIYVWDYIMQPATFFKAYSLKEVGYLNETLHWTMDWELWIKLALKYDVLFTDSFLACSREYLGTKTNTGGMKRLEEIRSILEGFSGVKKPLGYWIYYFSEMSSKHRDDIPTRDQYFNRAKQLIDTLPVPDSQKRCDATTYFAIRKDETQKNLMICLEKDIELNIDIFVDEWIVYNVKLDKSGIYILPIIFPRRIRKNFHTMQVELKSKSMDFSGERSESCVKMWISNDNIAEGEVITARRLKFPIKNIISNKRKITLPDFDQRLTKQHKSHYMELNAISGSYTLRLSEPNDDSLFRLIGWHNREQQGRWCSKKSRLIFKLNTLEDYVIKITYFTMPPQVGDIKLLFNGNKIGILSNGPEQQVEFLLPKSLMNRNNVQTLEFDCDGALSPKDAGVGEDARVLSALIKEITFEVKKG